MRAEEPGHVVADPTAGQAELRHLARALTDAVAADDRHAAALCADLMIGVLDAQLADVQGELAPTPAAEYRAQIVDLGERQRRLDVALQQIADARSHNWASLAEATAAELLELIDAEQDCVVFSAVAVTAPQGG